MKKRLIALLLVFVLIMPTAVAAAATYYRVNTSWLKMRLLPDNSAEVLDSYRKDFALTIKKKVNNTWSYVRFTNGQEGYVMTRYLTKGKSASAWITSDDTALRSGPAYTFEATGLLAKGAKVTVLTQGAAYDYVKSSVGYGYVARGYLSNKKVKASGSASTSTAVSGGDYTAWVINSGTRTVNFRAGASKNAAIYKAYAPGTEIYVNEKGKTWSKVTIEGITGYMMTQYITTNKPAPTAAPAAPAPAASVPYTAYVTSPNTKSVNVHLGKGMNYSNAFRAPYASAVTVLEHGTSWDYIEQNGKKGYILNKYLVLSQPDPTPAPAAPANTPAPVSFPFSATVTSENGEDVNLRMGPGLGHSHYTRLPVGTAVTVLEYTDKTWAKIKSGEFTGYIMRKFLK